MEYHHLDDPHFESMFPMADSGHQIPPTYPVDPAQAFYSLEGGVVGSTYEVYDERQVHPAYSINGTDEGVDGSKGPRLTPEQLIFLEDEFSRQNKPNTDRKRTLAERMGVEYPKVNNWFQNRRAKAKQESHARDRSDRSHQGSGAAFEAVIPNYRRTSDSQSSAHFSSPEQVPVTSESMAPQMDYLGLNDILPQYQSHHNAPSGQLDLNLSANAVDSYPTWQANSFYSDHKILTPTVQEISPQEILSTPVSIPPHVNAGQGNAEWQTPPMYRSLVGSNFVGNPSSHSFATTSSEDGEQARLITPPQETSPLPGLNQGTFQHDRQASNSSDLAENLGIVHLQQPQVDLSLNGACNTANSTTGLLTPEVSPDTAAPQLPFGSGHDLASRRKRPRPAALQPEPNRSVSYAGPMTTSPHLRISPPGSGKLSPVRRIKSTGNNSSVKTGRVKKSGTTSAQKSPRNFEQCFKLVAMSESHENPEHHEANGPPSEDNGNSLDAPSPQSFSTRRQGTWPQSQPNALPFSPWDQGCDVPNAHSVPEPDWALGQPNSNLHLSIPAQLPTHPHQYPLHYPPQSAPSHITTFDAALMLENPGVNWAIPPVQHHSYRDDSQLPMPIRPNHLQHHSHSGPFNHYQASVPSFPAFGPPMSVLMAYPQFPQRPSTPPLKSLDIKVETGPPPPKEMAQNSQERKEYTFENSFAGDAHFTTGSKK